MNETITLDSIPTPWFAQHREWADLYVFAWRLATQKIKTSRGRRHMNSAWSSTHNYQWVWDTCFMTLFCRYAPDQFPGVESLDNFYELQRDDGYIAMTYDMDTEKEIYPGRINPPLFAWVEWEHYLSTGDASRFERVIPSIERLMAWIDANRRTAPHRLLAATDGPEGGMGQSIHQYQLYYFEDCGSSGMDDSPRCPRLPEAGRFFDWIDLSCQMALSFRHLGRMHGALGHSDSSAHWEARAKTLGNLINTELWSERTRFYYDRMLPTNFSAAKTIAGFWPLLAEICPPERVADLVAHLENPNEFNRHTPIPTLSFDNPSYCERGTYWQGGVWAPTNYMVIQGLERNGQNALAHRLAKRYVEVLAETWQNIEPHTLWEAYSPEHSAPGITAYTQECVKPDFVGWTGLGPIAMLIESIMGIRLDAPEKTLHWDIRLTEAHGIKQLRLGQALVELSCEARPSSSAPAHITATSSHPIRLCLKNGSRQAMISLEAGQCQSLCVKSHAD